MELRRLRSLVFVLVVVSAGARAADAAPFTDFADFAAATTGLTTDDFALPPWAEGNYAGPVQSLGVTWSAVGTLRATSFMPHSGRLALSDLDPSTMPDTLDELVAVLPSGVTAAGAWLRTTTGAVPIEITAYDTSNVAVTSHGMLLTESYVFFGFTSDTAIGRLRVRAQRLPDDFLLDDFSFGTAATHVPEPTSVGLFCVGLLGVARGARRRG